MKVCKMSKPYYTLCTLEDGKWWPQFGDYSFNSIRDEAIDSYQDYTVCFIKTDGGHKQAGIDMLVDKLNTGVITPIKYTVDKYQTKLNKVKK